MLNHQTKFGYLDVESSNQVWLLKVQQFTRYHSHKRWNFERSCDLDLEHRNPIFIQDTPAYDNVPSNEVWLHKNS